jgi:hypothetical protein
MVEYATADEKRARANAQPLPLCKRLRRSVQRLRSFFPIHPVTRKNPNPDLFDITHENLLLRANDFPATPV